MIGKIAQMEAMRTLMLAKTSVSHVALRAMLYSHAAMTVAYSCPMPAVLRLSLFVRTVQTWLTPSAKVSVTMTSQELRIRIGGPVPMALRGVSSKRLDVTGIQIVMMPLN